MRMYCWFLHVSSWKFMHTLSNYISIITKVMAGLFERPRPCHSVHSFPIMYVLVHLLHSSQNNIMWLYIVNDSSMPQVKLLQLSQVETNIWFMVWYHQPYVHFFMVWYHQPYVHFFMVWYHQPYVHFFMVWYHQPYVHFFMVWYHQPYVHFFMVWYHQPYVHFFMVWYHQPYVHFFMVWYHQPYVHFFMVWYHQPYVHFFMVWYHQPYVHFFMVWYHQPYVHFFMVWWRGKWKGGTVQFICMQALPCFFIFISSTHDSTVTRLVTASQYRYPCLLSPDAWVFSLIWQQICVSFQLTHILFCFISSDILLVSSPFPLNHCFYMPQIQVWYLCRMYCL